MVPNFPRVPLRNVSLGLGVCAVLVRSVSPCRLVIGVELVEKIAQNRKEIVRSERELLKQILNSGVGCLIMCPKY